MKTVKAWAVVVGGSGALMSLGLRSHPTPHRPLAVFEDKFQLDAYRVAAAASGRKGRVVSVTITLEDE